MGLYEQTILPRPYTILGKSLKPFSFGHYILLRRFEVGFVNDAKAKLTLEDLVFSIYICSLTFEEAKQRIYDGTWEPEVLAWAKEITPDEGQIDFAEKTILFQQYLDEHTNLIPKYRVNSTGDSSPRNAEWYEDILTKLTGVIGLSESVALNMCFAHAVYRYLAYQESQGAITFLDEAQVQRFKEKRFATLPNELMTK